MEKKLGRPMVSIRKAQVWEEEEEEAELQGAWRARSSKGRARPVLLQGTTEGKKDPIYSFNLRESNIVTHPV